MLSFSRDPKGYIQDWLKSQSRDLKVRWCFFTFKRGLSVLRLTLKRLAAFCQIYDLEMKCRRVIPECKPVKLFLKPFIYTSDQSMSSPIKIHESLALHRISNAELKAQRLTLNYENNQGSSSDRLLTGWKYCLLQITCNICLLKNRVGSHSAFVACDIDDGYYLALSLMIVPSCRLQLMTDVVGNPEEERRAAFYHEPWSQEAVSRYFYCKVRKKPSCTRFTLEEKPTNIFSSWEMVQSTTDQMTLH